MNNKRLLILGIGFGGALVLAGCHDDTPTSSMPPPPATNMPVAFEAFTQSQVKTATCNTVVAVEIGATTFGFAADQDEADPRDISGVTPGCDTASG
jgi:hypothetical protein